MAEPGFENRENTGSFEQKKREYFTRLSMGVREALVLHKANGLWDRNAEGKRDWGNVSEHCLVETARVRVFSEALGLSKETEKALMTAAAMHDFFQKRKKEIVISGGLDRAAFAKAGEEATRTMREAGVSEQIIRLVNAVGDESLVEVQEVLKKEQLAESDIAYLVMHYVDDYTTNATWVEPVSEENGKRVNHFDRRITALEANPRYKKLNEEGRAVFNGETAYEAQRRIGHAVEARLAALMSQRGASVDPLALPEVVDGEIKKQIENGA